MDIKLGYVALRIKISLEVIEERVLTVRFSIAGIDKVEYIYRGNRKGNNLNSRLVGNGRLVSSISITRHIVVVVVLAVAHG